MLLRSFLIVSALSAVVHGDGYTWSVNKGRPGNATAGENIVIASAKATPSTLQLYATLNGLSIITLQFQDHVDPSAINVNWTKLQQQEYSEAISTKGTIIAQSVVTIPALIELNDTAGTLEYNAKTVHKVDPLSNISAWSQASVTDDGELLLNYSVPDTNCTLHMTLLPKSSASRDTAAPAMMFTANTTLIRLFMSQCHPSVKHSRWALPLDAYVADTETTSFSTVQSIDDEYSPSVFKTTSFIATAKNYDMHVSWKPVAFGSTSRVMTNMTATTSDKPVKLNLTSAQTNTIAWALRPAKDTQVQRNVVVFGAKGDKFTNQTTWAFTAVVGLGRPPKSKFSTALVVTLAACLGVPVLAFVGGGLYVTIKRHTGPGQGYHQINN
eukprot:TRINITY_DN11846_c0_g1_i1.p1 TRINITY_DN11846_c0_g1~~TRINITY_DN11846_c0_g1_i1.p1  ORF type:complete len:383 (+),score=66.80 TRINITY_DN11846_c0_g1_i1:77-1225(+)